MEKGHEHGAKSGGDSRPSEMPSTHIGPFVENEEKTNKKISQSQSRLQPKIPYWHVQHWLMFH